MPYTFGSAGGGVTVTSTGAIAKCAAGDGRTAIDQMYGLNVCLQCSRNLGWFFRNVDNITPDMLQPVIIQAFITAMCNTNLQGT